MLSLANAIGRFRKDDRGSLSVEAALMLPMLCFFYVGSFVWFDAFRAQNTNLKAGYTIADMLSRESLPVSDDYLNGLNRIFDYLTYSRHNTYIRVTSVKCTDKCDDDATRALEVCWSWASTGRTAHTQATLTANELDGNTTSLADRIPLMPLGDTVLMTETFMAYEPPFDVGIGAQYFEYHTVTRPRFAPEVEYAQGSTTMSCY